MRFDEVAGRAEQLRAAVATAAVELTSEDHAVTVTVGPAGAVRDLVLTQRAFRYGGAELGELIVRTLREANSRMSAELSATMAEITGRAVSPLPTTADLRAELSRERAR